VCGRRVDGRSKCGRGVGGRIKSGRRMSGCSNFARRMSGRNVCSSVGTPAQSGWVVLVLLGRRDLSRILRMCVEIVCESDRPICRQLSGLIPNAAHGTTKKHLCASRRKQPHTKQGAGPWHSHLRRNSATGVWCFKPAAEHSRCSAISESSRPSTASRLCVSPMRLASWRIFPCISLPSSCATSVPAAGPVSVPAMFTGTVCKMGGVAA